MPLQEKVNALNARLEADPGFSGLKVVQNSQSFRVLIKFKGKKPLVEEITSDPELQTVVEISEGSKSSGELRSLQDRIIALAVARKIETSTFPDAFSEKVTVHVEDVDAFRAALASVNIDHNDVALIKSNDFPRPH